jgi:hypothetical protein
MDMSNNNAAVVGAAVGGMMSLAQPTLGGGGGGGGGGGALPSDPQTLLMLKTKLGLDDMRHSLVLQIAQATGLNYQFSAQCLNETNWDANGAMEAFNAARVR